MTDLEGVAGVLDFENWCRPESRYYELAKRLLTLEVNAAIEGFFDAGADQVLVADGHGPGALAIDVIDERADIQRGWPEGPYPLGLDREFDACAWVGQHAMSGSIYAHLSHTQSFGYLDLAVNGKSIGEFGQLAMCASELGVRSVFASGDLAFTKEAQDLVPGIQTVAVKRGLRSTPGSDLSAEDYMRWNLPAVHTHPVRARQMILEGARESLEGAQKERFGLIALRPPFKRVTIFRPNKERPKMIAREEHESSFIALMNTPYQQAPIEG